jgi:23S rRNA pseudouridine1911/1915/1917 synthase
MEEYLSKRDDNKTRLWAVHRIDREVEGLIVFSKSEKLKEKLSENWSNFTKKYLALTEQKPENENGFIENWLREGENLKVLVSEKETDGSKFAKTEYTFLRTIGKYHLLEIKLHTGRKNQIRVHLAHIGCPIAGDRKYGAMSDFKRKVRLVAFYISFNHPVTEKEITIEYKPADTFYHPSQNADEKYKIF